MFIGPFFPKKTWETNCPVTPEYVLTLHCLSLPHLVVSLFFVCGWGCVLFSVHGSRRFHDVKVHLAMAPVAVMLNLHADALTAVCNWKYQRRRPTTGIKVAHSSPPFGATAVRLTQRAPTAYPLWSKSHWTVWPHQLPS
jgi:hypothetical protein